ncbi:hypothetical protein ACFLY4_08565 [Chloroflexota bacterium]
MVEIKKLILILIALIGTCLICSVCTLVIYEYMVRYIDFEATGIVMLGVLLKFSTPLILGMLGLGTGVFLVLYFQKNSDTTFQRNFGFFSSSVIIVSLGILFLIISGLIVFWRDIAYYFGIQY